MIQNKKRLWAILLSAALIVTQLPAVAMAENAAPEDGSIASFETFDSGVANQTVIVGTELSGLNLPYTVTADVGGYVLSKSAELPQITVTVAAATAENPTENPTGEPVPCTKTITGWSCTEYIKDNDGNDGNWPLTGEYTFTAKMPDGYACAPPPSVMVTLGESAF